MDVENDNAQDLAQDLSLSQEPEAQQEKLVPQSQVSSALRYEREKAYEKGKREEAARHEAMANAKRESQQAYAGQGYSQEEMRKVAQEEAVRYLKEQQQQAHTQQTVSAFVNKIEAATEKHPELKNQLSSIDFDSFAPIAALATDLDNTADIIAHIVGDPMKTANLLTLIDKQPQKAAQAIYEISNSLKQNDQAQKLNTQASEPFGLIQRSGQSGMGDESSLSVSDFRKMYR